MFWAKKEGWLIFIFLGEIFLFFFFLFFPFSPLKQKAARPFVFVASKKIFAKVLPWPAQKALYFPDLKAYFFSFGQPPAAPPALPAPNFFAAKGLFWQENSAKLLTFLPPDYPAAEKAQLAAIFKKANFGQLFFSPASSILPRVFWGKITFPQPLTFSQQQKIKSAIVNFFSFFSPQKKAVLLPDKTKAVFLFSSAANFSWQQEKQKGKGYFSLFFGRQKKLTLIFQKRSVCFANAEKNLAFACRSFPLKEKEAFVFSWQGNKKKLLPLLQKSFFASLPKNLFFNGLIQPTGAFFFLKEK